jgi:hypothetical protein
MHKPQLLSLTILHKPKVGIFAAIDAQQMRSPGGKSEKIYEQK